MIQYLNVFFYDIYPYICATVFFLGSWLRYDYGQYTWRASSSQMLDKRGMVIWSNLFHIGILGIFFGPSVWNADATLDVCLVPADCGKTADGDDPRRRVRRINVDRRRGITVASSDQSACAGDIHYT